MTWLKLRKTHEAYVSLCLFYLEYKELHIMRHALFFINNNDDAATK